MRKRRSTRVLGTLAALLILAVSVPPAAFARELENPWKRWTAEVLDRPTKAEIPLALLASIPAMMLITPIWAGQWALRRWSGE